MADPTSALDAPPVVAPPAAHPDVPPIAAPPVVRPPAPRLEPSSAGAKPDTDGFDEAWALLSGDEMPADAPLDATAEAVVEEIAERLRAHFEAQPPEPTSFPAVAARIVDLLSQGEPEQQELARAVGQDPATAAQIIRVANSALYHRGSDASDLRMAILRIGSRQTAEIALGVAGRSLFDMSLKAEFELFRDRWRALFVGTMAEAFTASQMAYEERAGRADRAFLGAMFHDIGVPVALRSLASLMIAGKLPGDLPPVVVDEVLERVHLDFGRGVLGIWNLPAPLPEICEHHHDPELPAEESQAEVHIVRLVTGVARVIQVPPGLAHLAETRQSLVAMGMDRRRMLRLATHLQHHRERVQVMYP